MKTRTALAAFAASLLLITATGCAVTRGQETTAAYLDDTSITTAVKGRFINNKDVDASSISVETMKGTVMLGGFAKSQNEKNVAADIASHVGGVVAVKNQIVVRP